MTPTTKKFIAGMFFLLSLLIIVYSLSFFFLQYKYPTSASYISENLESPSVTGKFKVKEATEDGYSNDEISEYLAKTNYEKFQRYNNKIFWGELAIFSIVFFFGLGFVMLKSKDSKKNKIKRLGIIFIIVGAFIPSILYPFSSTTRSAQLRTGLLARSGVSYDISIQDTEIVIIKGEWIKNKKNIIGEYKGRVSVPYKYPLALGIIFIFTGVSILSLCKRKDEP